MGDKTQQLTSKDLRIGNWVQFKETNHKVYSILTKFVYLEPNTQGIWAEFHTTSPIPLTVEWLKKFGFEKSDEDPGEYYHIKEGFTVQISENIINFYAGSDLGWRTIYYVHQLQNIHQSVTGYELEITL